jgi:hypothetical protein
LDAIDSFIEAIDFSFNSLLEAIDFSIDAAWEFKRYMPTASGRNVGTKPGNTAKSISSTNGRWDTRGNSETVLTIIVLKLMQYHLCPFTILDTGLETGKQVILFIAKIKTIRVLNNDMAIICILYWLVEMCLSQTDKIL